MKKEGSFSKNKSGSFNKSGSPKKRNKDEAAEAPAHTDKDEAAEAPAPPPPPSSPEDPDFSKDEDLLKYINKSRWLAIDLPGGFRLCRMNWVVTLLSSAILWAVVIYCMSYEKSASTELAEWQSWVTQNFTWLYIGSQDIWAIFLLWLCFSRYGTIKLGKPDEKPAYNDYAWFSMLFTCGIGIGLYFWGVAEPLVYYTQYPNLQKSGWTNADQRAQQALFMANFHWGLHGWVPYIVVAIALGLSCYKDGNPLAMRFAFKPLLGEKVVKGFVGDLIDTLSITCTTYGVCTSLGMGVTSIAYGIERLYPGWLQPDQTDDKVNLIGIITLMATVSVLTGLDRGIQALSSITFTLGNLLLLMLLFFDNTWYLLNSFVQSVGHYIQWVIVVGFECDTFQQLNYELDSSMTNLLVGNKGDNSLLNKMNDNGIVMQNTAPSSFYEQSSTAFMDYWTIFYWGWWISWAPFVGMFIARISRGRTIREVIIGSFILPTLFCILWFSIFGSLGIKMQRVAELTLLNTTDAYGKNGFDWNDDIATSWGGASCSDLGYGSSDSIWGGGSGKPRTDEAKALKDLGYKPLTCVQYEEHIYEIAEPYGGFTNFMQHITVIGIFLYFITSSDSGSYIDDLLSANGHLNPPPLQKIYWCFSEGLTAIALLKAGGSTGLQAIRAVSIVAGLPYTFAICILCTSTYRAAKITMGDADITNSKSWDTDVFDIFSLWSGISPPLKRMASTSLATAVIFPVPGIVKGLAKAGWRPVTSMLVAIVGFGLYLTAAILVIVGYIYTGTSSKNLTLVATFGWVLYVLFILIVTLVRCQVRVARNIYGSFLEDFFTSVVMFPMVISQMDLEGNMDEAETY